MTPWYVHIRVYQALEMLFSRKFLHAHYLIHPQQKLYNKAIDRSTNFMTNFQNFANTILFFYIWLLHMLL